MDMDSAATKADVHELRRELNDGMRETRVQINEVGKRMEVKHEVLRSETELRLKPLEVTHSRVTLIGSVLGSLFILFALPVLGWIARHW